MEKKNYLAPEVEMYNLNLEKAILGTSGENMGSSQPFDDWNN